MPRRCRIVIEYDVEVGEDIGDIEHSFMAKEFDVDDLLVLRDNLNVKLEFSIQEV